MIIKNMKQEKDARIPLNCGQESKHLYVEKRTISAPTETHWHSYFELEIIIDGDGTHIINSDEYKIERGCAYLLNLTDFHKVIPNKSLTLYNLSFDEEMISDTRLCEIQSAGVSKRFKLNENELSRIVALAELILEESKEVLGGCSRALCESLLTILMRSAKSNQVRAIEAEQAVGVRKALLYLDVHFRENPSLAQAAMQAGFHPNYFSELFRRATGETFTSYLNTLRISYAKTLLSKGFTVTEACYNSGFGSLSNFVTVFKKHVGMPPEAYKHSKG